MNDASRETGLFWLSICFGVRDLYEPVIFLVATVKQAPVKNASVWWHNVTLASFLKVIDNYNR